jgi:uncharacterized protein with PIN domain
MGNSETRKKAASLRQKQIRAKALCSLERGEAPRFVADVMLGRLAKWLRIAGFDVLYSNRISDDELVEISNRAARILLSRDTRLLVRKSVRHFVFLESQNLQDQLKQILDLAGSRTSSAILSRCLCCNEALIEAPREGVCDAVPGYVYTTHSQFTSCPRCKKIFWAGSHRSSMAATLEKLVSGREPVRESGGAPPDSRTGA